MIITYYYYHLFALHGVGVFESCIMSVKDEINVLLLVCTAAVNFIQYYFIIDIACVGVLLAPIPKITN